jgi:hypothetical protein
MVSTLYNRRTPASWKGRITLWTIQPLEVWEKLRARGVLFAEVNGDSIVPDYAQHWLGEQMLCRIAGHEGGIPWWAWVSPKPDLRSFSRKDGPGEARVVLELWMEPAQVLVSAFGAWHMPLNGWYLPLTDAEGDEWEARLASMGLPKHGDPAVLPAELRLVLERSWERVFHLDALDESGNWSVDVLQAVFERLDLENVKQVRLFRTR